MRWIPDEVLDHIGEASDAPNLAGTKYRLLGPLGRGGMGAVYMAVDTELDREVALKVSTALGSQELTERLRHEAQIIARLEHPGIVPVHDVGLLSDDRVFYVMKLVRGERLDRWASLQPARSLMLRLFQRICEAVAFAHAHGVIHRDLKPENVMVGEFGEALVMDWGLAKALADRARRGLESDAPREELALADALAASTMEGTVMGTPAYMPPEQARGHIDALDARSDVYSLGAILYFLLTRRAPFDGADAQAVLAQVIEREPPPVRSVDADVPRPLASICAKAMARDPAERYAAALDMADEIGRFLDGDPVGAHRETLIEHAGRLVQRHRVVLTLLLAYLVLRVLLAVFT